MKILDVLQRKSIIDDLKSQTKKEIIEELRGTLPPSDKVKVEAIDMAGMMGGTGAPVEIKILGRDFLILESISDEILDLIANVEGLRDIKSSLEFPVEVTDVKYDIEVPVKIVEVKYSMEIPVKIKDQPIEVKIK